MNELITKNFVKVLEKGLMPDFITRIGIRKLLEERLDESAANLARDPKYVQTYAEELRNSPLAILTAEANVQHYEVPTEFYDLCLGEHKKYSSCYWDESTKTLEEAEERALNISIEHAEIKNGMRILELGCGWGSLSLELARRFPQSEIVSVSNSKTQKEYIDRLARKRGLVNLIVLTRDLGKSANYDFGEKQFDRIVTIEMMEHLRNYELFFKLLAPMLNYDGKMFIHIFTNKSLPYYYETEGEDNWMGKYFFSGGQMPSRDLFDQFQKDLVVQKKWDWNGNHYSKTLEAWLDKTDENKERVLEMFKKTYGEDQDVLWLSRWRVFFMACSELFKYNDGREWGVTHYLLTKK